MTCELLQSERDGRHKRAKINFRTSIRSSRAPFALPPSSSFLRPLFPPLSPIFRPSHCDSRYSCRPCFEPRPHDDSFYRFHSSSPFRLPCLRSALESHAPSPTTTHLMACIVFYGRATYGCVESSDFVQLSPTPKIPVSLFSLAGRFP